MFRFWICISLALISFTASAAPAIDWRVKHPFRYFLNEADFNMHREAMADVMAANGGSFPSSAVSDLERLVNDPRWLREWYADHRSLYPDAAGAGRPERGWAHHINRRRATCWDAQRQWHSDCTADSFGRALRTDYVRPQGHTVIFSLTEAVSGSCSWQAERPVFIVGRGRLNSTVQKPCNEAVEARIPFEPDLAEADRGVDVSITLPNGQTLTQPAVWVRDRLIVGIGDSYSSGEGNPDTPVEVATPRNRSSVNYNYIYDPDSQAIKLQPAYTLPARAANAPAGWIDRKCHRSAYSYHLRTAIQVALTDAKHGAVTFLGYACSGSEVTEGLLMPYAGVESVNAGYFLDGGARRKDLSQLDRLTTELCADDISYPANKRTMRLDAPVTDPQGRKRSSVDMLTCRTGRFLRPIDMLIVSIGGNDVGFTPLIVNVLTKTRPNYANTITKIGALRSLNDVVRVVARSIKGHGVERARERAAELPARFAALRKALDSIPISKNAEGRPNIVLTAFPKVEFNQNGRLCGESAARERLEGFNVGGVLSIDVPELRLVSDFANNVLQPAIRRAAVAGNWHFAESHREAFASHGICAQKRGTTSVSGAEDLMLPYFAYASPRNRWFDFDPVTQTRAYAPRQRWFRTLNDICLFVQFKAKGSPPPAGSWGLLDLVESCLGGPFHPTAEGHSHIADAVYASARTVLRLDAAKIDEVRPPSD